MAGEIYIAFFTIFLKVHLRTEIIKSSSTDKLVVRSKQPHNFDRNPKRGTLSKKELAMTTEKKIKPRKFKSIKCMWLLGH